MTNKLLAILTLLTWTHIAHANDWSVGVAYHYDGAGNIKQIGTDRHVYDWAERLVQSDTNGIRRTFDYDAYGNRTKCLQVGGTDCTYSGPINPATNRLQNAVYDAAGNVIQFDGRAYAYDAFNMQTRETQGSQVIAEYIYRADDERIAIYVKDTGSWRWSLRDASGKVLREMTSRDPAPGAGAPGSASWNWVKDYVYRDGLLLASRQIEPGGATPTTYHYHLDHLGTPRRITDDSGRIVGAHSYHAFGPEVSDTASKNEPSLNRLKYTGHERDGELDYMHARYYDPKLGRFLSADPVWDFENAMVKPQMWNRYAYALNNPLRFIDPTGEVVALADLTPDERDQLLRDLNGFTGNEYGVNNNGELAVISYGQNASATATTFIDSAIGAAATYNVSAKNGSAVVFAEVNTDTKQITFDFKDFSDIDYNGVNPATWGLGSNLIHELAHVHPQANGQTLGDGPLSLRDKQVGPNETFVNQIRTERGLPHRGPAYEGRTGGFFGNRVLVNFQVGRRIIDVSAREYH